MVDRADNRRLGRCRTAPAPASGPSWLSLTPAPGSLEVACQVRSRAGLPRPLHPLKQHEAKSPASSRTSSEAKVVHDPTAAANHRDIFRSSPSSTTTRERWL